MYTHKAIMTLRREIGRHRKWKAIPCSCIRIAKMPTPPKVMYKFSVIPIKIPISFFTEIEKQSQSFYITTKSSNLEKNKAGDTTPPDFQLHVQASAKLPLSSHLGIHFV